ncbi:gamma-secretase-activating protein-like [Saccoglossus kowalevskii]|uniref:Gamma-secretase-activating protein-like n=1 Tax=Saccoglossus kowalevskii TaxID=10224 RepID=A0ABM0MR22_SACKO|nr:PREDICTED: gamma-secretase-activating protein-like [Saccoglossus kowalevskii]
MLDFVCCFDAESDIKSFVRAQKGLSPLNTDKQDAAKDDLTLSIIGQERNGEILYTWLGTPPFDKTGDNQEVTYIGLYDQTTKENSVIFIHEQKVCIVGCSINQEKTLIAFTSLDNADFTSQDSSRPFANIYKSFLAEVQPQNRIFSLNVERRNLLRCQFLYSKLKGFSEVPSKEAHMLFFLHKESIGLYKISLARMGHKGVVMSGQPRTKQIVKKFLWSQWDAYTQRLYFLQRRKKKTEQGDDVLLTCYEFKEHFLFETVLNLPLCLPLPSEVSVIDYFMNFLGPHVCDGSINLEVVSHVGGTLCICYQHPLYYNKTRSKKPTLRLKDEHDEKWTDLSDETIATIDVNYSVLMVHDGSNLNCCIPNVPIDIAERMKLKFIPLKDYILVYAPGYVSHLLNITSELEPCHHIAMVTTDSNHPWIGDEETSKRLVAFLYEKTSCKHGDCILDSVSGKAYKITLNKDAVIELFINTSQLSVRLSLLHMVLVHMKDGDLSRKLLVQICQDIASLESTSLLSEYLVATTYNAMKKQVDKDVLKLLPFTCVDTFRGQLEKDNSGQQIARFTYTPKKKLLETIICKPLQEYPSTSCEVPVDRRERRQGDLEFWDNIRAHLRLSVVDQNTRFCTASIKQEVETQELEYAEALSQSSTQSSGARSGLPRLPRRNYSSTAINKRAYLHDTSITIPFLDQQDEIERYQEIRVGLLVDKLAAHLSRYLKREAKIKATNIATEFVGCQIRQSKQLLQLLWTMFGVESKDECGATIGYRTLKRDSSESDYILFQVIERYYYVSEELCYPQPPGFKTFFAIIGYNSLSQQMLLQYLDSGVLELTPEFIALFIDSLHEGQGDVDCDKLKFQIINRLPQESMVTALQHWDHPMASRYLSQQYVTSTLFEDDSPDIDDWEKLPASYIPPLTSDSLQSSLSQHSEESIHESSPASSFPPLTTLVKLLEKKAFEGPRTVMPITTERKIDSQYVEENALYYTVKQCGDNLKKVTF